MDQDAVLRLWTGQFIIVWTCAWLSWTTNERKEANRELPPSAVEHYPLSCPFRLTKLTKPIK